MSDDVAVRSGSPTRRTAPLRHRGRTAAGLVVASVATLLVATGCTSDGDASPPTAGPTTSTTAAVELPSPELTAAECPDPSTPTGDGARISCHQLVVPEDRTEPDGRQVELPVLRFRADAGAADAGADDELTSTDEPVVYLHGGPGAGAVDRWATWSTLVDGLGGELVVYDQRGGGAAVPRLDCPEHGDAVLGALAGAGEPADERRTVAGSLATCHDRLVDEGVGLDHYDVASSVADLDDLRRALGVERLRLVATSYGTRLALDYAAAHPDHVASMALDSIDPPGSGHPGRDAEMVEPAIERLLAACGADPNCAMAHPDLGAALDRAVERFDGTPVVIDLPAVDGRPGGRVTVTGDDLLAGLFAAMYDSELVPLLPSAIEALAAGDDTLLAAVGPRLTPALTGGATGTLMSVNCSELPEAAPTSDDVEVPTGAATVALTGWDTYCDRWSVDRPGGDAAAIAPRGIPVLVVAGELDPITPATVSRRVAEELGATYLEVPRAGHAPMLTDTCARTALRSFLVDATAPVPSCERDEPVPFA